MKKVLKKLIVLCMCLLLCTGCNLKEIIQNLLANSSISSSQPIGGSNEGCTVYSNLSVLVEQEGVTVLSESSDFDNVFEKANKATFMSIACYVVGGVRYERLSSGFVIKKEQLEDAYKYYLVTNASKLFYRGISDGVLTYSKTPEYVEVVFGDYRRYYAQVEGYNEKLDVVVLSIITKDEIPVFELGDSDSLLLGDTVYAMGTPEIGVALLNSVNRGYVSKLNVESTIGFNNEVITTYNSHQFDAPTNLGMEGGPVFTQTGEVVGLLTYKLAGSDYESLSRFIPINDIKNCLEALVNNQEYALPTLGVSVLDLYMGATLYDITWPDSIGVYEGCYVDSVSAGSAAEKSGMTGDSVIVGAYINDVYYPIKDSNYVLIILTRYNQGDTLKLEVQYKTEKKVHTLCGD